MDIPRCHRAARVPEHCGDGRLGASEGVCESSKGMPQGVQRHPLQLGAFGNPLPGLRQALIGLALLTRCKHGIAFVEPRQRVQHLGRRLAQGPQGIAFLGLRQPQLLRVGVYFGPF